MVPISPSPSWIKQGSHDAGHIGQIHLTQPHEADRHWKWRAGTAAAALRSAFFDSFTSFAVATDRLSSEIATSKQRASSDEDAAAGAAAAATAGAADDDGIGADRKVLVLLSNCAFVRGNIMPSFASRYGCFVSFAHWLWHGGD